MVLRRPPPGFSSTTGIVENAAGLRKPCPPPTLQYDDANPGTAPRPRRKLRSRRQRRIARTLPPLFRGVRRHLSSLRARPDRKSTRLNSSHVEISYAVFCLK